MENVGVLMRVFNGEPRTCHLKPGNLTRVCQQPRHVSLTTVCLSPEGPMHVLRSWGMRRTAGNE